MTSSPMQIGLQRLRSLLAGQGCPDQSDEQLLHAFTTRRDDSAFAVLMHRHGPMVLHVCRRVLGHQQDAEDAFQAAFLVLARNAASLRNKASLASFLHGIAYRIAMKAKRSAARRGKHESSLGAPTQPRSPADPADELSWREVRALLDEEIARLPKKYQTAFVLCCLENLSQAEAARRLGLKERTLSSQLAAARKRLQTRLARRGVELTAVLAAIAVATPPLSAVPAGLMATTIEAALAMVTGEKWAGIVTASVGELVKGMSTAMMVSKAKIVTVVLLALSLLTIATSGSLVYLSGQASGPLAATRSLPAAAKTGEPSRSAADKPEKRETMSVTGQVRDPEGKPLAGTQVTVLAGVQRLERHGGLGRVQRVLGQSETDREGRFRLMAPRTSSLRNWVVNVVAVHAGYGLAWEAFDADATSPTVVLRLHPEQVHRGRLIDLQGQPMAGAKLHITDVRRSDAWMITLDGYSRHMAFVSPKPIVADKNGNFLIRGIGGGAIVSLRAEHESCSPERLELAAGETKTFVLMPARHLEGRVLYADTGKPVPHVEVGAWGVRGETDENGHFHLNPSRGPIQSQREAGLIMAYAPDGEPYLNVQKEFRWPQAADKHRVDLALPRGVLVRGRVTEKGSGKPVAGAFVFYQAQLNNPNAKLREAGVNNFANGKNAVTSRDDGTFQIACLPGAGYLTIEGPVPDYVLRENGGYDRLYSGKRGGQPWLSHGFAPLDFQLGVKTPEFAVELSKGVTLKAAVSGPAGQPVGDLQVFCPLHGFATSPIRIRGNQVELHGCDAHQEVRVMIFDEKNQWGATVEMSKKNASKKPMPIRLSACGSVRVRFLNPAGKPLVNFHPGLFLELARKHGYVAADTHQVFSPIPKSPGPHTDEQGWCILTALIPDAKYSFGYAEIETTFLAKSGEMLKLPDIVMKSQP